MTDEEMIEEYSYSNILRRTLSYVSDDIDKREGSVAYNFVAPFSMVVSELYKMIVSTKNSVFIDTSAGTDLDNILKMFDCVRKSATYAIKKGTFYDKENQLIDIPIGSRFSINSIIYEAIEKISNGTYQMQCETAGEIGNNESGSMISIDYIENLARAELADLLIPGENEETDDEYRNRFYETHRSVSFGGNIPDYIEEVKAIDGVGAVKVIRTWNGGGTVKIVILDSSLNAASEILIKKVQDAVGQDGDGIAPIGHTVTTVSAQNVKIDINTNITLEDGFEKGVVKTAIEKAINDYFTEVKEEWENSTSLTIRIAHIESRILNVNGVVDISNTKLNETTGNIIIGNEEIPILGEVTINE